MSRWRKIPPPHPRAGPPSRCFGRLRFVKDKPFAVAGPTRRTQAELAQLGPMRPGSRFQSPIAKPNCAGRIRPNHGRRRSENPALSRNLVSQRETPVNSLVNRGFRRNGAGEETRTLDVYLGKVVLYQLSYARETGCKEYAPSCSRQQLFSTRRRPVLRVGIRLVGGFPDQLREQPAVWFVAPHGRWIIQLPTDGDLADHLRCDGLAHAPSAPRSSVSRQRVTTSKPRITLPKESRRPEAGSSSDA